MKHPVKLLNAPVIGISESKLDNSVLISKIQTDKYHLLCCIRNRHRGGVLRYIRNDLSCNSK